MQLLEGISRGDGIVAKSIRTQGCSSLKGAEDEGQGWNRKQGFQKQKRRQREQRLERQPNKRLVSMLRIKDLVLRALGASGEIKFREYWGPHVTLTKGHILVVGKNAKGKPL